jgi:hypothetical protein
VLFDNVDHPAVRVFDLGLEDLKNHALQTADGIKAGARLEQIGQLDNVVFPLRDCDRVLDQLQAGLLSRFEYHSGFRAIEDKLAAVGKPAQQASLQTVH